MTINPETLNLSKLPWLPLEEKLSFPSSPSIYFCIDSENVIQYIGRSINLKKRWSKHHKFEDLNQTGNIRVLYLLVDDKSLLTEIENALISYFNPPLNFIRHNADKIVLRGVCRRRKKLGLTQRQIAETVGVTVQTVSNWETGTYQPKLTIEQTEKLCDVLQTDIKGLRMMFEAV